MKAYIDKARCMSDNRICKPLLECPQSAISWVEDDDEPLGSRMEIDHKNVSDVAHAFRFAADIALN